MKPRDPEAGVRGSSRNAIPENRYRNVLLAPPLYWLAGLRTNEWLCDNHAGPRDGFIWDSTLGVSHKGIFNGNQVRLYISPTTRIRVFRLSTQTEQHNNVQEDLDLYDVLVGASSPTDNIIKYVEVKPDFESGIESWTLSRSHSNAWKRKRRGNESRTKQVKDDEKVLSRFVH